MKLEKKSILLHNLHFLISVELSISYYVIENLDYEEVNKTLKEYRTNIVSQADRKNYGELILEIYSRNKEKTRSPVFSDIHTPNWFSDFR